MESSITKTQKTNWPHVAWFLGLTFGLTWLVDLALYLNGGLRNPATTLLLQFQMLLPAFSAIFLGAFFFKESPIYRRTNRRTSRWFIYYYLFLTLLYLLGAIAALVKPDLAPTLTSLLLLPNVLGLILLIVLRLMGKKDSFAGAGLAGGNWKIWLFYGLGLVAYYAFQTLLNYIFKLGQVVDLVNAFPQMAAANLPAAALMPIMALNTVVIGPFLGLIIAFGEEYGWRGYLQTELIRLGRVRGVFLLGVIWGIWHWPIIAMGHNYGLEYAGAPWTGMFLMVVFCVAASALLSWTTLRAGSVWPAVIGHAAINGIAAIGMLFLASEPNPLLGPAPTGIIGGIGCLLAAGLLFLSPKAFVPREDVV